MDEHGGPFPVPDPGREEPPRASLQDLPVNSTGTVTDGPPAESPIGSAVSIPPSEAPYPPELTGLVSPHQYRRDLVTSGLSVATIKAARVRTVPAAESASVATYLKWKHPPGAAFGDWLAIPYFDTAGALTGYVRLKPDRPRKGRDDRFVKYESPIGVSPRLYFPPNQSRDVYADITVPLVLVEGEKKALALVQHGFAAVGIAGVWSWMKKRSDESQPRELIDDFRFLMLAGRRVVVLFDSDLATNEKVAWAAYYLAETLKAAGADVVVATLAPGPGGEKVGADDALLNGGPAVIQAALDGARRPERPRKDEPQYEWTDLGNGRRLAAFARDRIRYANDRGVWLVYDGQRWAEDGDGVRVEAVAKAMLRKWAGRLAEQIAEITKAIAAATGKVDIETLQERKAGLEEEFSFAMKCQDVRRVRAMMALTRSESPIFVPVFANAFDADLWLVNCANGTYDVRTGEFHDHDPADGLTKLTPVRYEPAATAPLYYRFLGEIFESRPELIPFVRRLSGVAATGDACDQSLNIAWGEGANGKTTMLELWMHVLGEYAGKVPEELLLADKNNSRHPCEKVMLYGLRLAVASETGQDGRLDEARVKALTGGDTIMARGMNENFWCFPPRYTLFLLTNHRPAVRGTDHGIWRRLRLIPFVAKYWTDADRAADPTGTFDPGRKADPTLPDRLKAEAEGILRDMLDQATAYYADGRRLAVPACVTTETKAYRESEDVLGEFFATRVRADRDTQAKPADRRRTKGSDLYKAYKSWAEEAGYEAKGPNRLLGTKAFGTDAKKRLDHHTSNGLWYFAELVDPREPPPESNDEDSSESWRDGTVNPGRSTNPHSSPTDNRPEECLQVSKIPTERGGETVSDDSEAPSSETWRLGELVPSYPVKQKSPPIGDNPEIAFQVSITPNADTIVFANSDAGGPW